MHSAIQRTILSITRWLVILGSLYQAGCGLFIQDTKKKPQIIRSYSTTKSTRRHAVCPPDMAFVSNPAIGVSICVDRYEVSANNGPHIGTLKPLGYLNYYDCRRICLSRGRRLLTNKEWVTACEGTNPKYCNKDGIHPILAKQKDRRWFHKNVNCKSKRNSWSVTCMNDPALNQLANGLARNRDYARCISRYGIRHMVGNLGEWVSDLRKKRGVYLGRFNGGLYPQKKSSCQYTTIQHGPRYRDYSIGCRCGKDPGK